MGVPKKDKNKVVNKAGQPPFYKSAEDLQSAIEKYFATDDIKHTNSGLAFHLGFASRQSLYDYGKRPEFSYPIKRARLFLESIYEEKACSNNAAGPIFILKNMGWTDKQEIEHSGEATLIKFVNFKDESTEDR